MHSDTLVTLSVFPCLVQVVETLSRLHLVMEYAGGGELYTKITTEGKLSDTESKIVFAQILSAVKHMVSTCKFILKHYV